MHAAGSLLDVPGGVVRLEAHQLHLSGIVHTGGLHRPSTAGCAVWLLDSQAELSGTVELFSANIAVNGVSLFHPVCPVCLYSSLHSAVVLCFPLQSFDSMSDIPVTVQMVACSM